MEGVITLDHSLTCLNQVGWSILEPPMVIDHEQHVWNLLTMDMKTLETIIADAWCQHLAVNTNHKTMEDHGGPERSRSLSHQLGLSELAAS